MPATASIPIGLLNLGPHTVDDVVTTGSTVHAAAQGLLDAGARAVIPVSLALA